MAAPSVSIVTGLATRPAANLSNVSLPDELDPLFHDASARLLFVVCCCATCLVSFFGNSSVLVLLFRRSLLTARWEEVFLLNSCVIHLLLSIFSFLPTMLHFLYLSWELGHISCKLTFFIQNGGLCVVTWTTVMASLATALQRISPFRDASTLTMSVLAAIWLLSVVVHVPLFVAFKVILVPWRKDHQLPICVMTGRHVHLEAYCTFSVVFSYLLPTIILTCRLWTMLHPGGTQAVDHGQRKIRWLLAATAVSLILCLLPYQVRILWSTWNNFDVTRSWRIFVVIAYFLSYLPSAIHPILLFALLPASPSCSTVAVCYPRRGASALPSSQEAVERQQSVVT